MSRPLIGLCMRQDKEPNCTSYVQSYADRIVEAGGIPFGLPSMLDMVDSAAEIISRIDGILLTGGADVSPTSFGGHPYEDCSAAPLYDPNPVRDAMEEALLRAAWEADLPILGICRGFQVLNVFNGGTLWRDVSEIPDFRPLVHVQGKPYDAAYHMVRLEPDSRLAKILGKTEVGTNSLHHLAVATPAENGRVVAHASDGVVEAMEYPELTYCIAVQWHPEEVPGKHPLFESFVQAAAAYHAAM